MQFIASDATIMDSTKNYFLNSCKLEMLDSKYMSNFIIEQNRILNLWVAKHLRTNNAFMIKAAGKVVIDGYGTIILTKDTILKDGEMSVSGSEITLGSDFEVQLGGQLDLQINN